MAGEDTSYLVGSILLGEIVPRHHLYECAGSEMQGDIIDATQIMH